MGLHAVPLTPDSFFRSVNELRNPTIGCSILDSVGAKFPINGCLSITKSVNAKIERGINQKDKGVSAAVLIRNES